MREGEKKRERVNFLEATRSMTNRSVYRENTYIYTHCV